MPRELTGHKVNGCNELIEVSARDDPGPGGASHLYHVCYPTGSDRAACTIIGFQCGAIRETGMNGITNEALLAILIDRLQGFQSGMYACDANQAALEALEAAQAALKSRTQERLDRGVEGTHAI